MTSELELKRRNILKINQDLTNQLTEPERHFNSIELNIFEKKMMAAEFPTTNGGTSTYSQGLTNSGTSSYNQAFVNGNPGTYSRLIRNGDADSDNLVICNGDAAVYS